VAQLVEALRYEREGREFDPNGVFGFFRPQSDPGVDSASNSVEYQGYFLGVKAAGA
jgi:hypothetical protein